MLKKMRFRLILLAAFLLVYGASKIPAVYSTITPDVTVGSKNFTESVVLAEIYAQALEQAGFHVNRKLNLGGTLIAHEALKRGEIDFYPEYTGTGLIDILKQPPQQTHLHEVLDREYQQRWHLRWLESSSANDGQGLVVTKTTADRYGVYTLSKLSQLAPQLTMAGVPEFEERADALPGLQKAYGGFQFKKIQLYDHGLKYRVLQNGQADVTVGFTTDGILTDPNLVLLKDDRHFWPQYRITPVIRESVIQQHPEIEKILNQISKHLTTETVQKLNAEVDLQHREAADVAHDFLEGHS